MMKKLFLVACASLSTSFVQSSQKAATTENGVAASLLLSAPVFGEAFGRTRGVYGHRSYVAYRNFWDQLIVDAQGEWVAPWGEAKRDISPLTGADLEHYQRLLSYKTPTDQNSGRGFPDARTFGVPGPKQRPN